MSKKLCGIALALLAFTAIGCSSENPLTEPSTSLRIDASAPAGRTDLKEGIPSDLETEAGPRTVVLPAGSVDGLAAAIAAAGPNGKVIVEAGHHTESGTVTITHRVEIAGQPGAVLISDTDPTGLAPPLVVEPALHVLGASKVSITGLEFRPSGSVGGTAILFENAPDGEVRNNRMSDYQNGVMLQHGDRALIRDNVIAAHPGWRTGALPNAFPIVAMNGDGVRIIGNDCSNGVFNIFACDEEGTLSGNRAHGGRIGIILCKVPQMYLLPGGAFVGAENAARSWMVHQNLSENNRTGYLVIDSASGNTLVDNDASGNSLYDMELTADTFRFGFLTPASFDNTVRAGRYGNIRIKDCGNNNTVIGGQQVDITTDPCN